MGDRRSLLRKTWVAATALAIMASGLGWRAWVPEAEAAPPVASSVAVAGTARIGETLTGTYAYTDTDGDAEGATQFQWYAANSPSGTGKTAIPGATGTTLTVTDALQSKFITFEATPVSVTGEVYGMPASSAPTAAVTAGPGWYTSGPPEFTLSSAAYSSMQAPGGKPYIAFQDGAYGERVSVMTLDAGVWKYVGTPGFSAGTAKHMSLRFDGGTPYVAFADGGYGDRMTVMRYDGAAWSVVGAAGFTHQSAEHLAFDIDNGTPYVAYRGKTSGEASVMRYDGVAWSHVGAPDFTVGGAWQPSLDVDNGIPHLAFRDNGVGGRATVMSYDGAAWGLVGARGFSSGAVLDVSLLVAAGKPYVAYMDGTQGWRGTVMTYDGVAWSLVGPQGFTVGAAQYGQLFVSNGEFYYGYQDDAGGGVFEASMMKFDGAAWANVGARHYSVRNTFFNTIYVDNGNVYTAFTSEIPDGLKATVMYYGLNAVPTASGVTVAGAAQVGQSLTATYAYADSEYDAEGGTTFQWYAADDASGAGKTAIPGATGTTLALTPSLAGKFVTFEVVPQAVWNAKVGVAAESAPVGPIAAAPVPPPVPPADGAIDPYVPIFVNEAKVFAGLERTETANGRTTTTVAVDRNRLETRLSAAGHDTVVAIPIESATDVAVAEIDGELFKALQGLGADVTLRTKEATYALPTTFVDLGALSARLGSPERLRDLKLRLTIARPTEDEARTLAAAVRSEGWTSAAPPMKFALAGVYGSETVDVPDFERYVVRSVALSASAAGEVKTGIAVEADGEVRHVPTFFREKDGATFAEIRSMTNGAYVWIDRRTAFADTETHWGKDDIADMASRTIVEGTGEGRFEPDRAVTRAEFAAMLARGLGLKSESGAAAFSDVKRDNWFYEVVATAHRYRLIEGFGDGAFRPNERIAREQAMTMLHRAMGIVGLELDGKVDLGALSTFADGGDVSAWAASGAASSLQAGIVRGRDDGTLGPRDSLTRAEAIATIRRLLQQSGLINR